MVNNMKKIPLRTCVISKEKLDKRELFRVVRNKDGEDKKILDYHLGVKVSDEIYDELINKL